jgi:hypothetical protein
MEIDTPSEATAEEIDAFTSGDSHLLAVALHRRFGWRFLVVTNARDAFWVDPADPGNVVPEVVHVYAITDDGSLFDIRGRRSRQSMRDDMYGLFDVQDFEEDECRDEGELAFYVGSWSETGEPVERPLSPYTDDDLRAAEAVVDRAFPWVALGIDAAIEGLSTPKP